MPQIRGRRIPREIGIGLLVKRPSCRTRIASACVISLLHLVVSCRFNSNERSPLPGASLCFELLKNHLIKWRILNRICIMKSAGIRAPQVVLDGSISATCDQTGTQSNFKEAFAKLPMADFLLRSSRQLIIGNDSTFYGIHKGDFR